MKHFNYLIAALLILISFSTFNSCKGKDQPNVEVTTKESENENFVVSIDSDDIDKIDADTLWLNSAEDSIEINEAIDKEISSRGDTTPPVQSQVKPENIIRIEGLIKVRWKGVAGCCDQNTVNKQAKKAIEQWVGMQVMSNRPHQYYRSGKIGPTAKPHCQQRQEITGKRSCRGSWNQKYFIEFIRQ